MAGLFKSLASAAPEAQNTAEGIGEKAKAMREYNESVQSNGSPAPAPAQPTRVYPQDRINPRAKYGDRGKEKRIDVTDMVKPLGSFKKGGKVKKTGIYKLHKGEKVQTLKQQGLAKGLSK
jgi:hypothetical protein